MMIQWENVELTSEVVDFPLTARPKVFFLSVIHSFLFKFRAPQPPATIIH